MHATHSSVPNTPPLLAHTSTPSALFPSESLSLRSPPLPPSSDLPAHASFYPLPFHAPRRPSNCRPQENSPLFLRVLRTPQASPAHPRRRGLHRRRLRCLPATQTGQIETLDASLASPSLRFRRFIVRLWISDSDSDDPGLLAVQQALKSESRWHSSSPALLLQQKKEKKRPVQQNRRQRAISVREGAQKIIRAWEAQLEGF